MTRPSSAWRGRLLVGLALALPVCSSPEDRAGDAREVALAAIASRDWGAAQNALLALRSSRPDTPDTLAEVANLMVEAGEAPQAVWVLEDAIARFPASDALRVSLARAALSIGQPGRARLALEPSADGSPALAEALVERAHAWLALGDAAAARAAVESARVALEGSADLALESRLELARLGLAALEGDGETGLAELRARLESDPADATAWAVLARELRREGRADEARSLLEAALAADPDRIDLYTPLAATHAALGDDVAAERVLRDRIDRHPTSGAHLALARLRASRGDLDAALARYGLALTSFPNSAMLRGGRTELLLDLDLVEDARTELGRYRQVARQGPQAEYLQARLELSMGNPELALRRLDQVVKQLDSPSTQYWLGSALEATGDLAGAEERYLLALRASPDDASAAIDAARLASLRGDWRSVARAARLAVEHGPHESEGWELLADALAQLGEWEEAEKLARRRLERFPEQAGSHVRLAEALRAQRRLDEALAVLDAAGEVGVQPEPRSRKRKGRKRHSESEEAETGKTEQVAVVSAEAPAITAERVLLLGALGRSDEALAFCDRSLARRGDSARLQAARAALLLSLGREREGVRAVDIALASDPEDLRPLRRRAEFYVAARRYDSARRDCELYLSQRPDDPRVHFMHGLVFEVSGRMEEAVEAYRRSVELDEQGWSAANNLAMLLVARGELDEALAAAEQAHANAEGNVFTLDTLGFVALRAGQAERAVGLLEQARQIAPKAVEIQLHLAEAYGAAARSAESRRLLADLRQHSAGHPELVSKIDAVQAALP